MIKIRKIDCPTAEDYAAGKGRELKYKLSMGGNTAEFTYKMTQEELKQLRNDICEELEK